MIAIINEHEYILNNYYTEQSGRLHLFINNTEPYDLNQLKEDIETGPVVIKNEESENIVGTFTNYTILRSLEIRVDVDPQIYAITDVESPSALLNAIQIQVDATDSSLQEIEGRLNLHNNRITDVEETANSALSYYTSLEQNLNSALERLDHAENLLNEIIAANEDSTPPESDQNM